MSKTVQMYYANLTNIDLAMFMPDGRLRGDSFNLHVKLSGEEDPKEAVLIDFSTAKKRIKAWIDDHKGDGFDHKCWVTLHPQMAIDLTLDTEVVQVPTNEMLMATPGETVVSIKTPFTTVVAPRNCFHFMDMRQSHCDGDRFTLPNIIYFWEQAIEDYLEAKFLEDGQKIEIEVKLTNNMSYPAFCEPELNGFHFRYTHGLKHSTSFGCQNVAHGHISYIAFKERESVWGTTSFWPGSRGLYADDLRKIVDELDGVVFAWEENVERVEDGWVYISYRCDRGEMRQRVRDDNCIILPVETTVEHLAEFVAERYAPILQNMGIESVYVSEGLEKGGIADVE